MTSTTQSEEARRQTLDTMPKAAKSTWRRTLWGMVAIVGVSYALLLVYLARNQQHLIFAGENPVSASPDTIHADAAAFATSHALTPVWLHAGGETIAAFYGTATANRPSVASSHSNHATTTLLWLYGSGGTAAADVGTIDAFRSEGLNVLCPDYIGYGFSTGRPSEQGCYAAADAGYTYLLDNHLTSPGHLIIAGDSLGTGVAIDLAARRPCAGLVTVSAFTSMAEAATNQYPVVPFPIIKLILKYPFASAAKIGSVRCPILLVHARDDQTVPFWMSNRLAQCARSPVTRLSFDYGGHNEIFEANPTVFDTIGRFCDTVASVDDGRTTVTQYSSRVP